MYVIMDFSICQSLYTESSHIANDFTGILNGLEDSTVDSNDWDEEGDWGDAGDWGNDFNNDEDTASTTIKDKITNLFLEVRESS